MTENWRDNPDWILRYRESVPDPIPPVSIWFWIGAVVSSLGFLVAIIYFIYFLEGGVR